MPSLLVKREQLQELTPYEQMNIHPIKNKSGKDICSNCKQKVDSRIQIVRIDILHKRKGVTLSNDLFNEGKFCMNCFILVVLNQSNDLQDITKNRET